MNTNAVKVIFSLAALSLILLHLTQPNVRIDSTTLGLLIAAALPWLSSFIKSAKLPGGWEVQFQEVRDAVKEQSKKIEQQQEIINQLTKYSMSASIFRHLCGIALLKRYIYRDGDAFRREMYFLRDNGYLEPRFEGFIDFNAGLDGKNLAEIVKPTPIGASCIKIRDDVPEDLLKDASNLRIDLKTFRESA